MAAAEESFELLYSQLEAFRPLATGEITSLIDAVVETSDNNLGDASAQGPPSAAPLADLCVALVEEICELRSENYALRQDIAGGRLSHRGVLHHSPRPRKRDSPRQSPRQEHEQPQQDGWGKRRSSSPKNSPSSPDTVFSSAHLSTATTIMNAGDTWDGDGWEAQAPTVEVSDGKEDERTTTGSEYVTTTDEDDPALDTERARMIHSPWKHRDSNGLTPRSPSATSPASTQGSTACNFGSPSNRPMIPKLDVDPSSLEARAKRAKRLPISSSGTAPTQAQRPGAAATNAASGTTLLEKLQAAVDLKIPPWESWGAWDIGKKQPEAAPSKDGGAAASVPSGMVFSAAAAAAACVGGQAEVVAPGDAADGAPVSSGAAVSVNGGAASKNAAPGATDNWVQISQYAERLLPAFGLVGAKPKAAAKK